MTATGMYYEVVTSSLEGQMQQIDQLDAKAATAYAFASVIVAFFAGLLAIASLPTIKDVRIIDIILLLLTGFAYVFGVICIFKAYNIGNWSLRPDLNTFQAYCLDHDENSMRQWVANERLLSIQANEPRIKEKTRWLHRALILLAFEAVSIAITGALTLLAR